MADAAPRPITPGQVALVGAGPGDPGLLTVRGLQLLQSADVVVYDALANPALLGHCPDTCEKIFVGKRAAHHAMPQTDINALLVRLGLEGKRVVRLKGGDPFVFGRGGEECESLALANVRFEVVPGITAAIAAPAYAGIPVTHRDLNSSFTLITGHEKEQAYQDDQARDRTPAAGSSDLDWASLAQLPAMAFYMGVKSLPRICAKLIENGMDPATPAASIRRGTWPDQQTVTGTLADLPARVADASLAPPVMTIIGKIVSLRSSIAWFEKRPLFGTTVVVTRTRTQAGELSAQLAACGAQVLEAPTIELLPAPDRTAIARALQRPWDWIVFTSANGARAARARLNELDLDVRAFGRARVAAIGQATADAVRSELSLRVDLVPQQAVAEALANALQAFHAIEGSRFLLLRAEIARLTLMQRLNADGAQEVLDLPLYVTKSPDSLPADVVQMLDAKKVHWITFASSSTARNFVALLGPGYRERLEGVKIASIGPITSQTLEQYGLPPTVQADQANLDALVQSICRDAQATPRPS